MQNRRFRFLRVFAVLAVLLSAMGSLSLSASAAPLNMASPQQTSRAFWRAMPFLTNNTANGVVEQVRATTSADRQG